jgi:hypothetical protein
MTTLSSLRRKVAYAGRHYTPTWKYGFNYRATFAYRGARPPLSAEAARILAELNRNGIALTSVAQLLGENDCFRAMESAVVQLEQSQSAHIEAEREAAQRYDTKRKTFLVSLLGDRPTLDPTSAFVRFPLQQPILAIVNEYFGMYTCLRFYNVWHTLRTHGEARESQLWHYDRDDHLIIKIFLYLSDVDDGAGPFTYAPRTHVKGTIKAHPPGFLENGVNRVRHEDMAQVVPMADWVKAVGRSGTLVFADTRGYHFGGLARERDRIMYNCMFTSPTAQVPEHFARPQTMTLPDDPAAAMALTKRRW